jgi:hypothetical protein
VLGSFLSINAKISVITATEFNYSGELSISLRLKKNRKIKEKGKTTERTFSQREKGKSSRIQ